MGSGTLSPKSKYNGYSKKLKPQKEETIDGYKRISQQLKKNFAVSFINQNRSQLHISLIIAIGHNWQGKLLWPRNKGSIERSIMTTLSSFLQTWIGWKKAVNESLCSHVTGKMCVADFLFKIPVKGLKRDVKRSWIEIRASLYSPFARFTLLFYKNNFIRTSKLKIAKY